MIKKDVRCKGRSQRQEDTTQGPLTLHLGLLPCLVMDELSKDSSAPGKCGARHSGSKMLSEFPLPIDCVFLSIRNLQCLPLSEKGVELGDCGL